MLGTEKGSTSPSLLPARSLPPERVYTPSHTIFRPFALDEDRVPLLGELLAASCGVQLLPFSRHWIFPFLENQCKIDPGSRAGSSSAHSASSSTFPCSWWDQLKYLQRS